MTGADWIFPALLAFVCIVGLAQITAESGDDGWGF